jgi:hypothetical protein
MMHRLHWSWAAVAVAVALTGPGCGGGGKVKVTGVVQLDGKPIEGAQVTYHPIDPNRGQLAYGTTDKAGVFQLSTTTPNDGAFRGEYKVTVVYAEGAEAPSAAGMKDAFRGLEKARNEKQKPPRYIVPDRYGDPGQTELRQKVPPDGKVILELRSGK